MLYELTETKLKINNPRWIEIYSFAPNPTQQPVVEGGTPLFLEPVYQRNLEQPRTAIDPDTLADPQRDDQAWNEFVAGIITEPAWRQRQKTFGLSDGFNYILDGIGGNKVFQTDRSRYDRILAELDGDVSRLPGQYWTNERYSSQPLYYQWVGCCTSNGGNWQTSQGNVIEVDVGPDTVMYVRALVGPNSEYEDFSVTNGSEDEDITEICNRQIVHSLPTGDGRPQKPRTTEAWGTEKNLKAPKLPPLNS